MSLFEFLTVAVSIILALGLARLVHGLRIAGNPRTRYWVHFGYIAWLIVVHLLFWWALWGFQANVEWNFGRFMYLFLGAILLYSLASTLIPDNPGEVTSWRDHFFGVRRSFFWVFAALSLHQGLASLLVQGVPPIPAMRPIHAAGVLLPLVGAVSASPRIHTVLVCVFLSVLLAAIVISFGPVVRS